MISSEEVSIALGAVLKLQDTGIIRLEPCGETHGRVFQGQLFSALTKSIPTHHHLAL
jgi:hypothetical protein